jgi:thioredoxin reductase
MTQHQASNIQHLFQRENMNTNEAISRATNNYQDNQPSRAVVVGGTMAGMLAAMVLSDYFDQVTIIAGEKFADGSAGSAGTAQTQYDLKIRNRIAALPNVEVLTDCEIVRLIQDNEKRTVCGVAYRDRSSKDVDFIEEHWLFAALTVEAGGSASKSPDLLDSTGHSARPQRRPEGLIVLGDGAFAFSPVNGHRKTTAAFGTDQLIADCGLRIAESLIAE